MDNNPGKKYLLQENVSLSYRRESSENLLIHGDSLFVLELLREQYKGKINCIYMDPPYCSGTKNKHYSDCYSQEEYMKMMQAVFALSYELLADTGFMFVQMGREYAYMIRGLIESEFTSSNFRNEIIIRRDDHKVYTNPIGHLASGYDSIFLFSKNPNTMMPVLTKKADERERKGYWKNLYRSTDGPRQQYHLCGLYPYNGNWRWTRQKALKALHNYEQIVEYALEKRWDIEEFDFVYERYIEQQKILHEIPVLRKQNGTMEFYVPPSDEICVTDNWTDLDVRGNLTDFEHEVNKEIIRRIITWVTSEGETVLDPFLGSGTSLVVSSEMNRKWIGIEKEKYCCTDIRNRINKTLGEMGREEEIKGYRFFELNKTNNRDK